MEKRMETLFEKEKFIEAIQKHDSILIFHHINPDGDCLGSSQGLLRILEDTFPNKKIGVIGDNNNVFNWLNFKYSNPEDFDLESSLAIVCDVSGIERVESNDVLQKCGRGKLRIDHHPNISDYATITALFVDSPATCQIVAELAKLFEWKVSAEAATFLYLGLNTDSGRFLYRSVTERTFDIASQLVKWGADRDFIHQNLYKRSVADIKFEGNILSNYTVSKNGEVVYHVIDKKFQDELGFTPSQCARVNLLANIENYKAWLFFIEYPDHIRVEFRCKPGYKINEVAFKFNGGGHNQAAGCKINSFDDVNKVVAEVEKMQQMS